MRPNQAAMSPAVGKGKVAHVLGAPAAGHMVGGKASGGAMQRRGCLARSKERASFWSFQRKVSSHPGGWPGALIEVA